MIRILLLGLLLTCVASAFADRRPAPAKPGTVLVQVLEPRQGYPLLGANAVLRHYNLGTCIREDGAGVILWVPAGRDTLSITAIGYRCMWFPLTVKSDSTVIVEVRLCEEKVQEWYYGEGAVAANSDASCGNVSWEAPMDQYVRANSKVTYCKSAGSLHGRIITPGDAPAGNVRVRLYYTMRPYPELGVMTAKDRLPFRCQNIGSAGKYYFSFLLPGAYVIELEPIGEAPEYPSLGPATFGGWVKIKLDTDTEKEIHFNPARANRPQ